jgi:hypothetical protein
MPGTLDLHDWTEGGRRSQPPTLRERIAANQQRVAQERSSRLLSQKLEGPVQRAVTRAVKQTDFQSLVHQRTLSRMQFAPEVTKTPISDRLAAQKQPRKPSEVVKRPTVKLRKSSVERRPLG